MMGRFLTLAESGKLDELEIAWMEEAEKADIDWPDMMVAARVVASGHDNQQAESLILYLTSMLADGGRAGEAFQCTGLAAEFLPGSERLREEYAALYVALHEKEPWRNDILAVTVNNPDLSWPEAVAMLKEIERFAPGTYVRRDPGAKVGRVEKIIPGEGLELKLENGTEVAPVHGLDKLHALPPDDIRALTVFEPERLSAMAEEDPVELVRLVLKTFDGRADSKRIRRYLQGAAGGAGWKRWWNRVSMQLDIASDIGSTGGADPQFFIRSTPVSRAEELGSEFDRATAPLRLSLALKAVKETDPCREEDRRLIEHIAGALLNMAQECSALNPGFAACTLAVMWKAGETAESMAGQLQKRPDWLDTLEWAELLKNELCNSPFFLDILDYIPRWLSAGWDELFLQSMPFFPLKGCERAIVHLQERCGGEIQDKAVRAVMSCPDACLGSMLWVWRLYRKKPEEWEGRSGLEGLSVLRRLLSAAAFEGRADVQAGRPGARASEFLKEAFSGNGETAVETAASAAGDDEIRALINLIERNPGLSDYTRRQAARAVRAARPELFRVSAPPWQEDAIYTTRKGLQKRRQAYEELVNVKIPAIVRQIGEAAAFGDLSENAEYAAALEERERLSRSAGEIKNQLRLARIIPPDMPDAERVSIGSRVKARDRETGSTEMLTFLGPWDADPQEGLYAYNSPLALAFMGAGCGEEVNCDTESGRIKWKFI